MFVIIRNPNKEVYMEVTKEVEANSGYCPCALQKLEETKCPCKEFRDQKTKGYCRCGRYLKTEEIVPSEIGMKGRI